MQRYLLCAAALIILWFQTAAAADNQTMHVRPAGRFGRGVVNIISSPLELPAQMYTRACYYSDTSEYLMATIGGFIEGIPMGALVYFPWRLAAGIYDLFTFPFPSCDRCIIEPPYVSFSTHFLDKK